jgi:hypothetical protein
MACVLCCGTIRQSKWLSFIPWRTFCQRRRNSSADHALGMDAGEMRGFGAERSAVTPACGDWLQTGSVAPASETATPDDAPRSKSLRDKRSEDLELENVLNLLLLKNRRNVPFAVRFKPEWRPAIVRTFSTSQGKPNLVKNWYHISIASRKDKMQISTAIAAIESTFTRYAPVLAQTPRLYVQWFDGRHF